MCSHLRLLSDSYPMNTNMTGFRSDGFQNFMHPCDLDESSLSIGRLNDATIGTLPDSVLRV